MKTTLTKISKYFFAAAILILLSASSIVFLSCSCNCGLPDKTDVPLSVLTKANDFVISKTGKDLFQKYFSPEFEKIEFTGSEYKMVYRFYMPEKSFVNGTAEFFIDTAGTVDKTKNISGIPDYKINPLSCKFDIDETKAIQAAKGSGLEQGVKNWKTGFLWDKDLNQYVWHVLSTFNESGKGKDYQANGKDILIDPNTGYILKTTLWKIAKSDDTK
jgi:hypothetical protein